MRPPVAPDGNLPAYLEQAGFFTIKEIRMSDTLIWMEEHRFCRKPLTTIFQWYNQIKTRYTWCQNPVRPTREVTTSQKAIL
ncbi:hypothetical protein HN011_008286 [Eciton burchellii]|jgi:hypothetical protein|nr:hypothetical protein HN011_008286 [Eciton burchellii]